MNRETIRERLAHWKRLLSKLMDAYEALIDGEVQSYEIDDRSLTKFDIPKIQKAIEDAERKIDEYEAMLSGKSPRKVVAVVPRDW